MLTRRKYGFICYSYQSLFRSGWIDKQIDRQLGSVIDRQVWLPALSWLSPSETSCVIFVIINIIFVVINITVVFVMIVVDSLISERAAWVTCLLSGFQRNVGSSFNSCVLLVKDEAVPKLLSSMFVYVCFVEKKMTCLLPVRPVYRMSSVAEYYSSEKSSVLCNSFSVALISLFDGLSVNVSNEECM